MSFTDPTKDMHADENASEITQIAGQNHTDQALKIPIGVSMKSSTEKIDMGSDKALILNASGSFKAEEAEKKLNDSIIEGKPLNSLNEYASEDCNTHESMLVQFQKPRRNKEKSLRRKKEKNLDFEAESVSVVYDDDYEDKDVCKSLERAKKLALHKQGETPQAIATLLLASAPEGGKFHPSGEKHIVLDETEEFVRHLCLKADNVDSGDGFLEESIERNQTDVKHSDEGMHNDLVVGKEEFSLDQTTREVEIGKGLSGTLRLLKDRGAISEKPQRGGRTVENNDIGVSIRRTDEFGRNLTIKEQFKRDCHRSHGKCPGKKKQEKSIQRYQQDLKAKQLASSDAMSLTVEEMIKVQAAFKIPYIVVSGNVKPGQASDRGSGFNVVEKKGLTPTPGDRKVEQGFGGLKRNAEPLKMVFQKKPKKCFLGCKKGNRHLKL